MFIGPPGSAMRSLGDKISSTIIAQHAKVPCIPWSGSSVDEVTINPDGIVTVDDKVYKKGCVQSWQDGLQKAKDIGFPVMIKASEGGGGKGIRKCEREEDFKVLYNAASSEIPGSPIFIMKLAKNARHLEVQLLADQYGNNISLFGRDCSVQRRHQKIIEEAPAVIAKPEIFEAMEKAAVRLGRLVGYVSAGTVEFLYADDKFYFLELNPRLQVEHPTTEMTTGVNLPAAQLQIAMGLPLHRIRDIRQLYGFYQETVSETGPDDGLSEVNRLQTQQRLGPKGHTIACRITSEDPGEGFKPSSGIVHDLNFRSSPNVWGYFSVSNTSSIHSFSDSQFGHIFAYGETRSAARKHMVVALKELNIRGDFRTTVEYLIQLLETPEFQSNDISTGWLDELIQKRSLTVQVPDPIFVAIYGAVCKAHIASEASIAEYQTSLEKGQVLPMDSLRTLFPINIVYGNFRYEFTATRSSLNTLTLFLNGPNPNKPSCSVNIRVLSDNGLLILFGGKSHIIYWKEEVGAMRLSVDNKVYLLEQEHDPTQLRTPSPGKLVHYHVDNGAHVKAGDAFAEVEVMKMYMPLLALEDGIAHFVTQPGTMLEAGDILGTLTLDNPSRARQVAQTFLGDLPDLGPPQMVGTKPIQRFRSLYNTLENVLDGFDNEFRSTLGDLIEVLRDPELPYSEWGIQLSVLYSRIPQRLMARLTHIVDQARVHNSEFPARSLSKALHDLQEDTTADDVVSLQAGLAPLIEITDRYDKGLQAHEFHVLSDLLDHYTSVENHFSGQVESNEEIILRLRNDNKDDIFKVIQIIISHNKVGIKNELILAILDEYEPVIPKAGGHAECFLSSVRKLTNLESRQVVKLSLRAQEVLMHYALPSVEDRTTQIQNILQSAVADPRNGQPKDGVPVLANVQELVDSRYTIFDTLPTFFAHQDPQIAVAALEVYVRRAYRAYPLKKLQYHDEPSYPYIVSWDFMPREMSASGLQEGTCTSSQLYIPSCKNDKEPTGLSSVNGMPNLTKRVEGVPTRKGVIISVQDLREVETHLIRALEIVPFVGDRNTGHVGLVPSLTNGRKQSSLGSDNFDEFSTVCYVAMSDTKSLDDQNLLSCIQQIVNQHIDELLGRRVGQLTFICGHADGTYPGYYTFRGPTYEEDQSVRHSDPALATQLEQDRLSEFNTKPIFTKNRSIHIYEAISKESQNDKRYFARAIVRQDCLHDGILPDADYLISESSRLVNDTLSLLEIIGNNNTDLNHIFLKFLPVFSLQPLDIEKALGNFLQRFRSDLWRLRVTGIEISITHADPFTGETRPLRVVITNTSGFVFQIEIYIERKAEEGDDWVFQSIGSTSRIGTWHLQPISTPYATRGLEWLQVKRYKAHLMGTQYVYDFPELFRQAIQNSWDQNIRTSPSIGEMQPPTDMIIDYTELVLDEHGNMVEVVRSPGNNTHGVVAWIVTARTVEYPRGRRFVIIANDITFRVGSFAHAENDFYYKCTEYARNLGIPRIYLSANSGARIGIAEELIPYFSVAWNNPENPEAGFKYLYLTPQVKKQLDDKKAQGVITEKVTEDGELRYKILMIADAEDGHGMDCMTGSGLIAAVTSKAYEDIFTITLVTCRSVGKSFSDFPFRAIILICR